MHTKTRQLINIMELNNLTAEDVAKLLDRQVNTIRVWRCDTPTSAKIPDHLLELLKLKVQAVNS